MRVALVAPSFPRSLREEPALSERARVEWVGTLIFHPELDREGHGFSHAAHGCEESAALAAEADLVWSNAKREGLGFQPCG